MSYLIWLRSRWGRISTGFLVAVVLGCVAGTLPWGTMVSAGGAAVEGNDAYHVLAPIESGNLLLFPVVRASAKAGPGAPFLTLDEGLKSGSVEVTEAGKVRGLVRPRGGGARSREPGRRRRPGQYPGPG